MQPGLVARSLESFDPVFLGFRGLPGDGCLGQVNDEVIQPAMASVTIFGLFTTLIRLDKQAVCV